MLTLGNCFIYTESRSYLTTNGQVSQNPSHNMHQRNMLTDDKFETIMLGHGYSLQLKDIRLQSYIFVVETRF